MYDKTITHDTVSNVIADLKDARQRTLELLNGLDQKQIIGPQLSTVNPMLWEIGHVAYFYELWTLRYLDNKHSLLTNADELYDSINIAHEDRWTLPLLTLERTKNYMQQVLDGVIERLEYRLKDGSINAQDIYLTRYAIFHEDMHTEAFTYTRRTLDYPSPTFANNAIEHVRYHQARYDGDELKGDVTIEGGDYLLGAKQDSDFCFDNEKWQHSVNVKPYSISRTATTYQQYAAFVEDGGYNKKEFWDDEGWQWLQTQKLFAPQGWKKKADGNWLIKQFDQWQTMRPNTAVIHISWFEAKAWCRWANRRLASEAEWELAASGTPDNINAGRTFPWGEAIPDTQHCNMDGHTLGTIDVSALPEGDSAFGCRQMLGNVWEWTEDTFHPYPGFTPDMYQDYSQPLFGTTKVLRGGAWPTRSRMLRNSWRNYYGPDRNDVFAGFRTCAL